MALYADDFTIEDLDRFEGQLGRHELLDGALLVTPLGTSRHQWIAGQLFVAISNFLERESVGVAFSPGRVVVDDHTALEPDVLVIPGAKPSAKVPWKQQGVPLLTVEVLSPSSRSFDRIQKREAYLRRGAQEYWIVDATARAVTVVRPNEPDQLVTEVLRWHPAGAREALTLDLAALFG